MWQWFKQWLVNYDRWCQEMGLTPEQKRICVPYRSESNSEPLNKTRQS